MEITIAGKTFHSVDEMLKYKEEHPDWQGVQEVSINKVIINRYDYER